jgi:ProP effector
VKGSRTDNGSGFLGPIFLGYSAAWFLGASQMMGKHTRNTAKATAPVIQKLAERFPTVFVADKYQPHKPLAYDIRQQLRSACPELARRKVTNALYFYSGRLRYREALIEGAPRFDITGKPVGTVTAEEAQHAKERAAEDKARRASQPSGISGLKPAAQQRKNRSK